MNFFQVASDLLNNLRPDVAGHRVHVCRGEARSLPFMASSPPSGHDTITAGGMELSEFDRVFFWKMSDCTLGKPQRGDVIVDENDERYTVRPSADGRDAWKYHGQNRNTIMVIGRRDF